jgi:hypothetical protein
MSVAEMTVVQPVGQNVVVVDAWGKNASEAWSRQASQCEAFTCWVYAHLRVDSVI